MTESPGFWRETREAVRATPGFAALLALNLLGGVVSGLVLPILPLFLLARGFSLLQLGGLFSVVAVAGVLVHLLAGRYPEAFGRPGVVIALSLVQVLQFAGYVFVREPLGFFLVAAVGAFAGAAAGPGTQALLAQAAPIRTRARVFSLFGMLSSLAYAAAVVAAYALADVDYKLVFLAGSLAGLAATFILVALRLRERPLRPRARFLHPHERDASRALAASRASVARAWSALGRSRFALERGLPPDPEGLRRVRHAAAHLFLFGLALAIYPVYFPLYLLQHGLPMAWMGLVVAGSWVAFALTQPLGAKLADKVGLRVLVLGSILAAAALNAVLALATLPFIVLGWLLLGAADGLGRPLVSALVGRQSAHASRVTAYAWTQGAGAAARVVAPYALAFAIAGRGVAFGLLLVAFVVLASAVPLAVLLGRDEPTPPAPRSLGVPP